jgi:starch synthase
MAIRDDRTGQQRTVALLPWGNVIEDFLDPIGLTLDEFCERMTGGWLFGYVEALRLAGWRTVLVVVSRRIRAPARLLHVPSGTPVCVLPAWKAYDRLARRMINPYGWLVEDAFGRQSGLRRLGCSLVKETAPYLATPLGALARTLRREGCAAILTQEYEYARFDLCVLLGRLLGLPVYATFQGGDRHAGRLEELIRGSTLRAASGLAVGAEGEARRLVARYGVPGGRIWPVHNPIDLEQWWPIDRAAARRALGVPLGARIVVCHGRIDMHRKGLDVLLDAWARASAERAGCDVRLLLIGTGQDDAALRAELDRRQLPGIQWIDRYELDRAAMRRYLSAADLYVLPSRIEGFPVAPLEAMACGLPVVASDIPALRTILKHGGASGGLLFRQGDPIALADALGSLLDNPDRSRKLGRIARYRVEQRFSIPAVSRQLHAMLEGPAVPRHAAAAVQTRVPSKETA